MTVTTTAELLAAIKAALPGSTITLAPGTYSGLYLAGVTKAVTLTSADPANPAVLLDMNLDGCGGFSFTGITFRTTDNGAYYNFILFGCSDITITACLFDGPGMAPKVDTTGLLIRNDCQRIAIRRCEFKQLVFGVATLSAKGLEVIDCFFHDMRCDGIRGGGVSGARYRGNFFTNFHPNAALDDHPDAIQFWTVSQTVPATDIAVTDNVIVRGATGSPLQGVFVKDESNALHYTGVTVSQNIVLGGMYNALYFDGVDSGAMAGNYVAAFPDMQSWIRTLNGSDAVLLSGNQATQYICQFPPSPSNLTVPVATDGGLAALKAWAMSHPVPGFFATWDAVYQAAGLVATVPLPVPAPAPAPVPVPIPAPIPTKPRRRRR